jgi:hypothetical protein
VDERPCLRTAERLAKGRTPASVRAACKAEILARNRFVHIP